MHSRCGCFAESVDEQNYLCIQGVDVLQSVFSLCQQGVWPSRNVPLNLEDQCEDLNQCTSHCWSTSARHDLLKAFNSYNKTDAVEVKAALGKFFIHLWYVPEETVGLFLFDPEESLDCRRRIILAMRERSTLEDDKRIMVPDSAIKGSSDSMLKTTLDFFTKLHLNSTVLASDPEE